MILTRIVTVSSMLKVARSLSLVAKTVTRTTMMMCLAMRRKRKKIVTTDFNLIN